MPSYQLSSGGGARSSTTGVVSYRVLVGDGLALYCSIVM